MTDASLAALARHPSGRLATSDKSFAALHKGVADTSEPEAPPREPSSAIRGTTLAEVAQAALESGFTSRCRLFAALDSPVSMRHPT